MNDTSQRWLGTLLGCLLGAVMVLGGFITSTVSAAHLQPKPPDPVVQRRFIVQGTARVQTKPDVFRATVDVASLADTATAAQAQLRQKMDRLLTKLTQLGVLEQDLATGRFSLQPESTTTQYRTRRGYVTRENRSFVARNCLSVKVRKIDHAGQFIDGMIAAGAERVGSVSFGVDDVEPVRGKARALAAKNARDRAQAIATASGATLGRVVTLSETPLQRTDPWRRYRDVMYQMMAGVPLAMDVVTAMPRAAEQPEDAMEPGTVSITASVYVEYELG